MHISLLLRLINCAWMTIKKCKSSRLVVSLQSLSVLQCTSNYWVLHDRASLTAHHTPNYFLRYNWHFYTVCCYGMLSALCTLLIKACMLAVYIFFMSWEGALFCGAVNIWRIYSELKVQWHCLLVSRRAMYFENILAMARLEMNWTVI
jgi:hypothetical protein